MGELWKRTLEICRRQSAVWWPVIAASFVATALVQARLLFLHSVLPWLYRQGAPEGSVLAGPRPFASYFAGQQALFALMLFVSGIATLGLALCPTVAFVLTAKRVWRLNQGLAPDQFRWRPGRVFGFAVGAVLLLGALSVTAVMITTRPSLHLSHISRDTTLWTAVPLLLTAWLLAAPALWLLVDGVISAETKRLARVTVLVCVAAEVALFFALQHLPLDLPRSLIGGLLTSSLRTMISDLPDIPLFVALALLAAPYLPQANPSEQERLAMEDGLVDLGPVS